MFESKDGGGEFYFYWLPVLLSWRLIGWRATFGSRWLAVSESTAGSNQRSRGVSALMAPVVRQTFNTPERSVFICRRLFAIYALINNIWTIKYSRICSWYGNCLSNKTRSLFTALCKSLHSLHFFFFCEEMSLFEKRNPLKILFQSRKLVWFKPLGL